eukprot:scaffold241700_cov28-Tisochrysis_lutea.AAC.2
MATPHTGAKLSSGGSSERSVGITVPAITARVHATSGAYMDAWYTSALGSESSVTKGLGCERSSEGAVVATEPETSMAAEAVPASPGASVPSSSAVSPGRRSSGMWYTKCSSARSATST